MSSDEVKNSADVISSLDAYEKLLLAMQEIGNAYIDQAAKAQEFLKAQAVIEEHFSEGTYRSVAKAEIGTQELAERFLGDD